MAGINRKQRRALKKKGKKVINPEKAIMMKQSDIEKIREEAFRQASENAMSITIGTAIIALIDKLTDHLPDKINGVPVVEFFANEVLEQFSLVQEGYVSLEEINEIVKKEGGIEITIIRQKP